MMLWHCPKLKHTKNNWVMLSSQSLHLLLLKTSASLEPWREHSPVTGASMSRRFFSERRIAAPSPINRSATLSSTRPSLVRWAFNTSTFGLPSLSNTSLTVSRWLGGNGTARSKERGIISILVWLTCNQNIVFKNMHLFIFWSIIEI